MTPYLVQRAKTKTDKRSLIVGIDSLLSYDYMGSAEFEFGALGLSLKALFPVINELQIYKTNIKKNGQGLFVICNFEHSRKVGSR